MNTISYEVCRMLISLWIIITLSSGNNNHDFCEDINIFRILFESNNDHVSIKWDNYLDIYHDNYQKYIGRKPNVLQIGVQNGGSLQIAKKYFLNANIHGIDINPDICKLDLGDSINTYCFDVNDNEKFEKAFEDTTFDIIEDDASHISSAVITSFIYLFPKLNPGGTYLIEDLHASYWSEYEGGYLNKTSSIEFLKRIIDLLHAFHMVETSFSNNLSIHDYYCIQWIESITFYDSVAVIKKLRKSRSQRYNVVKSGKLQPIVQFVKTE